MKNGYIEAYHYEISGIQRFEKLSESGKKKMVTHIVEESKFH